MIHLADYVRRASNMADLLKDYKPTFILENGNLAKLTNLTCSFKGETLWILLLKVNIGDVPSEIPFMYDGRGNAVGVDGNGIPHLAITEFYNPMSHVEVDTPIYIIEKSMAEARGVKGINLETRVAHSSTFVPSNRKIRFFHGFNVETGRIECYKDGLSRSASTFTSDGKTMYSITNWNFYAPCNKEDEIKRIKVLNDGSKRAMSPTGY